MLTAGEMLREQRLKLKLTYTGLSGVIKISPANLKALEKNQFERLPAYPFLKGMVQNYAKALSLDPVKAVAVFKRDYIKQQKKVVPAKMIVPSEPDKWRRLERPATLFAAGLIFFAVLVGWSWWRIYQPPRLKIDSPLAGQTAVNPVIVSGKTDRDAALSLNGKTVNLEADGRFRTEFIASPGIYRLELKAVSRRQQISEAVIEIKIIE